MTQFEPMVDHLQNELAITKKSLQDRLEASSSSASMKRPAARAMTLEDMVDDQDAETEPPSNPEEPDDVPTPPWRQTPKPAPKVMANPPINIPSNEAVVTPALSPASELPRGYSWVDWNEPEALLQEATLAEEHKIPMKMRGPCSPMHGGPDLWRDIPFNEKANAWMYTSRDQLPASYRFDDWWSEDALNEEARLAREHLIPWCFRGPPDGPGPGNRKLWRGLEWRPKKKQWMNRGGKRLEARNHLFGKGSAKKKDANVKGKKKGDKGKGKN